VQKVRDPRYSDRAERRRRELGLSIGEVARQVQARVPSGERGASYSGIRLYLSPDAPANPSPTILRELARVLGVSVAYLMGETNDPTAEGEADVRQHVWAALDRSKKHERDAIERAFPDARGLSAAARAAFKDVMIALRVQAIHRGQESPDDTETARRVGKALMGAIRGLGLDKPDEWHRVDPSTPRELRTPLLHLPPLSDFVVLTCQGLKRVIESSQTSIGR
jgi:transcriptional regulator with XRE-family HTH domain